MATATLPGVRRPSVLVPAFALNCLLVAVLLHLIGASEFISASMSASYDSRVAGISWCIAGTIFVVAAQYGTSRLFMFSGGFWLSVNIVFYILLKTVELVMNDLSAGLMPALVSVYLFMVAYIVGIALCKPLRPAVKRDYSAVTAGEWKALYRWALGAFILFKLFTVVAMRGAEGTTALDASLATQNDGAAYFYRIGNLAGFWYLFLIIVSYRNRIFVRTSMFLTAYLILDAVVGAARSAIVLLVLAHLFLMHIYVRPVKLWQLLTISPVLLFVIAFFGYVRDIEIGSSVVYLDAFTLFRENYDLVFTLFMQRMDMLPQMVKAFVLAEAGELKMIYGASYLYEILHTVPRSLWPGKPPLTAAYLTELTEPGAFAAGVNLYSSVMVEGYINFAWAGVAVSGLLVALVTRWYERLIYNGQLYLQVLAVSALSFPMGLINEGFHSNYLAGQLYGVALFFLTAYACKIISPKAWRAIRAPGVPIGA
ncbi:hypothetical protein BH09PSE5_BH09PSE5_43640 [soil metagenome]